MRNLKTKQKLTLMFTLYFSVFLFGLAVLFVGIFRFMYTHEIRRELTHEFKEVIADHIGINKTGVFFKKDKNGDTLRLHLFNDGVSALFTDKAGAPIRKYGIFESRTRTNEEAMSVNNKMQESVRESRVIETTFLWNSSSHLSFVTPLKYQNNTVGIMVLAKSMDEVKTVTQNAVVVIAILGILALGGSFFMGYYFTQRSLNPINSIISLAERTTLHRMEKKAHIEGHPEDEFVRLADTFNRMLERLDEMSRRQREFVANASHELKTPLTRAITTLDVMQSGGPLNPEDLSLVKEDLMQINELIERLLVLGKINEGQLPAGTSSVRSVIAKIRDQMAKELQGRNLMITPSQEENLIIHLPQSFAEIIFSNVLSNAIKYSPAGSEINIHIDKEAKSVTVTDKGAGMTDEEKTRVFDRFFRGKESRQMVKGYGLGLNLVKQICDVYGIQIEVRSEKGKGTSFIMHF